MYCIIAWTVWWMDAYKLSKIVWNSRFWNFSRNRLASDEWPPGDSSFLCWFWVPEEKPLGGKLLTARQRVTDAPVLGFCLICLAVMNNHQATRAILAQFWGFLGFGKILTEGKANCNCKGCFLCQTTFTFTYLRAWLNGIVGRYFYGWKLGICYPNDKLVV